jgi:hypothetical protein
MNASTNNKPEGLKFELGAGPYEVDGMFKARNRLLYKWLFKSPKPDDM